MYLCFNDQILIDHDAGSEDFSGDPITSSPSGIGYAVYDCPPSIAFNGELSTIQTDPCLTNNPPPTGGAVLPYIATPPNTTGDILFDNDGGIQNYFNAGAPVLKWFAPILSFTTEEIYRLIMNDNKSIHLTKFLNFPKNFKNDKLFPLFTIFSVNHFSPSK